MSTKFFTNSVSLLTLSFTVSVIELKILVFFVTLIVVSMKLCTVYYYYLNLNNKSAYSTTKLKNFSILSGFSVIVGKYYRNKENMLSRPKKEIRNE